MPQSTKTSLSQKAWCNNPTKLQFQSSWTRKILMLFKCYESTEVDCRTWLYVPSGAHWTTSSDTHQVVESANEVSRNTTAVISPVETTFKRKYDKSIFVSQFYWTYCIFKCHHPWGHNIGLIIAWWYCKVTTNNYCPYGMVSGI